MRRRRFIQISTAGLTWLCGNVARADDARPTADEVKALTLQATQLVADKGIEPARIAFNQEGTFKHGEIYVNVIDTKGTWVIYPPKPEGVGKVILNLQDADGKFLVRDILKVADENVDGGWIEYRWKNPTTNLIQPKQSYVKKVSGTDYIVYIGVYK
jgi:signal transduction histidine kinase